MPLYKPYHYVKPAPVRHQPPRQPRVKKVMKFRELADLYHRDHELLRTKRPLEYRQFAEKYLLPKLGGRRVDKITTKDMIQLHLSLARRVGKTSGNRVISMAKAIFNFGIRSELISVVNPCYGVQPFREYARDRFLSKTELKKFFRALELEAPIYQDYFQVLLYTGARKTSLLRMRWRDVNFELKQWRIPETESKNNEVNIVVLTKPVMTILKRRYRANQREAYPSDFVFPGSGKTGHLINLQKPFDRLRDRTGIQDMWVHDLRRTLGSYMAISGTSLPIIGAALNHKTYRSTLIYARLTKAPVLKAVEAAVAMIKL